MKTSFLSRTECSALRGIAIIAIMLHNYCHWLGFAVKENEFTFNVGNSERLWNAVCHPDDMLPVHLLSYFGHYGVPVFLFLSGLGLVLKYERREEPVHGAVPFIRYHYLKLLRMMIPGFAAFIIFDLITPGSWHYQAENVIGLLLMLANLFPDPDRVIWPGPYWFFGLMLQLYAVYRLLLYRRHWGWTVGLIALCWLPQAFCAPSGDVLNRLRYNCIGGVLPFGVGILFARYSSAAALGNVSRWAWAGGCLLFSALMLPMCFGYQSWLFAPLLLIAASVCLVKSLPVWVIARLEWFGSISAAMFVIHPVLRKIFIPVSRRGDVYDGLLLYIIATVAVSWLFKRIIDSIPSPRMETEKYNKTEIK